MYKSFERILALFLSLFMFTSSLTGCGVEEDSSEVSQITESTDQSTTDLLREAFIYSLPLVIMDATYTKSTNTVTATSVQAPANQFFHAEDLATADFTDVVTPNVDTIYSQVFLDLSEDAVVLEFPKTDRFCTVEVLDAYTNCIAVLDAAQFESEIGKYIFTGNDFEGEVPEGMTEIGCPTSMVWILVRTLCYGQDDVENVYEIQKQMDSYTLSQYESETTEKKPEGTFDESNNFNPVQHVQQMSMQDYFSKANELMIENPPVDEDAEIIERISQINVGPGMTFDDVIFGENVQKLWAELLSGVAGICLEGSQEYMVENGCWTYYGEPIAEFGTAYEYRALIALVGLGANPVSIAVYPKADHDSNGERLSGENQYVLHFEKDQLPPVEENGFWSVTAYNSSNNLLIDNELNRYCINDRSAVQYNEDGSLDIYIQSEKPENGKVSNWLLVSEEEFHLVLRIYLPEEDVIDNAWVTPEILKH